MSFPDREAAIDELRDEAAIEHRGEMTVIHVCQGPGWCDLQGDDAVRAQERGCPWCSVITIHPDGTETRRDPPQPV